MKLKYTKPSFAVERFNLSQSIANNCGAMHSSTIGGPTSRNKTDCGRDVGGYTVWTAANQGCSVKANPNEIVQGVCYNNPVGGNTIFAS